MIFTSKNDLLAPLTDLAVEIVGGVALAVGGILWAWWRWGPRKRLEINVPDRVELANKFAAAARQVEILADHDAHLTLSGSFDELWPKIERCLTIMMEIGFGPAAKIATGNAGGGLSKKESRMAMLMVGSISGFATRYAHNLNDQRISTSAPGKVVIVGPCLLGLDEWADLFRFSAKVFDPTRRTAFRLWRLERRLRKRLKREKADAWTATSHSNSDDAVAT